MLKIRKISLVKKIAIVFVTACVVYKIINCNLLYKSGDVVKVDIDYVAVHFDLKGSPPLISYMITLLSTFKKYGVNSILIEYEDMFPYEGMLANLSSEIAYTKHELTEFLLEAKKLDIEIIPLVQTFGHMEFVLKLKEFYRNRELPYGPAELCPSQPSSLNLIRNMLSQVITFHNAIQPLKHIHIGCDEVYTINVCSKCTVRNLKSHEIYYRHLINVKDIVQDIRPRTKVLFWSEIYSQKHINLKYELQSVKDKLSDLQPVDWEYNENVYTARLYKTHEIFDNMWVASAFKGADGIIAKTPDMMKRYLNHIHWLKQVLMYRPPRYGVKIKGIILTGWSRYSHFARQCELLPFAMPSLILNLMLIQLFREGINWGILNNHTHCELYDLLLKKDFEKVYVNRYSNLECSFRNVTVYEFRFPNYQGCLSKLNDIKTDFEVNSMTNVHDFSNTVQECNNELSKGVVLSDKLRPVLSEFYRKEVIDNYLNENVNVYDTLVGDEISELMQKVVVFYALPKRSFGPLPNLKYGA
ncbi:hexosaminidase D-like [Spodoptera frugiperda]|uniref:beta-N-acetylhexosaminidase n=1 Tax=Spodoptera frugiperda TaxID=7108 RepID=A0A9R0DI14_SPOFR|nr:hexosaminidase D-like [Spodoptera frugiperda]